MAQERWSSHPPRPTDGFMSIPLEFEPAPSRLSARVAQCGAIGNGCSTQAEDSALRNLTQGEQPGWCQHDDIETGYSTGPRVSALPVAVCDVANPARHLGTCAHSRVRQGGCG